MQHLAIIPDGNRRWAKKNLTTSFMGHQKGVDAVHHAVSVCLVNNIKYLSLYAFSLENFRRDEAEKKYLFKLMIYSMKRQLPDLIKKKIYLQFVGDRSSFPTSVIDVIDQIERETSIYEPRLIFSLLFCYGGQQEIAHAAQVLAQEVKEGVRDLESITADAVKGALWTTRAGLPDPDLIIRTGKMMRLSNFFLFQAAYAELCFLDCYWPEITEERLQECINMFSITKRNFGQ